MAVYIILAVPFVSQASVSKPTCAENLAGRLRAQSELQVRNDVPEPSRKNLPRDEVRSFMGQVASGAINPKTGLFDEVFELAWNRNESGFLQEVLSVDEYLVKFANLAVKKYDFDTRDRLGRTPLMHAGTSGFFKMQLALLKIGARIDIRDRDGRTAAELAALTSPEGVTTDLYYVEKYLSYRGFYIADAVWDAFGNRDFKKLKSLFDHAVYVDVFDLNLGKSLLTHAIEKSDLEMARFLLENGADPNFGMRADPSSNQYPVQVAAAAHNIPMLDLLLDFGAKIDARGMYSYERNPVRQEIWNFGQEENPRDEHLKMIHWLLAHGANPNAHVSTREESTIKGFIKDTFADWRISRNPGLQKKKKALIELFQASGF